MLTNRSKDAIFLKKFGISKIENKLKKKKAM